MAALSRSGRVLAAWALGGLVAVSARAERAPNAASVVWTRGRSVWVASDDSTALAEGDVVRFASGKRAIARGWIERRYDAALVIAVLDSGSLERVRRLDRLRVLAERPPARAAARLRLGVPGPERSSLWFACDHPSLAPPPSAGYREESVRGGVRLVRPSGAVPSPWPDTLLVRPFADVADEEIALERGELDAAVYWPGESSRTPATGERVLAARSRGLIASVGRSLDGEPAESVPDGAAVEAMNAELFRGDLGPWASTPARGARRERIEVDPACPGHRVLERALNRGVPPEAPATTRLVYVDAPIAMSDSLALAVADAVAAGPYSAEHRARAAGLRASILAGRARGGPPSPEALQATLADSLRVVPLFLLRCPVVTTASARAAVASLGATALADLLQCPAARREP